jgi:hypothetical protein
MWIRDLGWKECGSGMEKIGIRDRNTDSKIVYGRRTIIVGTILLEHSHCNTRTHTGTSSRAGAQLLQDQFKINRTARQCCGSGVFSPDIL